MTGYGLPARGQLDYDDELNNSIEAVRGTADAAKAEVTSAVSTANSAVEIANAAKAKAELVELNTAGAAASAQASADSANASAASASASALAAEDAVLSRIPLAEKGAANGVASLDASGKIVQPVPSALLEGTIAEARIPAVFTRRDTLPINVGDYGTTDTAVRSALAAAVAAGRGLHFPAGTYTITGNLTIDDDRLAVSGDGDDTLLAFTDGGLVIDGATTAHALRNRFGNFRVTRAGTVGPAVHLKGGGVGTGVARFGLYDIHVESSTGTAWRIDGSYIGAIVNCYGRGSTLGLDINVDAATGVVGGNLLTFVGCEFQDNDKAAYLKTTAGVTFLGCGFEGNSVAGVELDDNCRAVTFINPYFEANGGYDIKVGTTTAAIVPRIVGGYFADGGIGKTGSIFVVKSEDFAIDGAFFSGFGANSPVQINEAGAGTAKGHARNCWSNGSAPIVALNGATQWGQQRIGRADSTPIKNVYRASAVLDFPSIAAGGSANLTINVPGAAVGDDATAHYNGTPPAGLIPIAWVSGVDTVTVRLTNVTGAAIDPPAATMRAIVWKF